jgi:3'(2'), 5'-bisphosphate nucleotidase
LENIYMNSERLGELLELARSVAWGAGQILLDAEQSFQVETAGESPVTSADLAANRYILNTLQAALDPEEFAYLTEETFQTQDPAARLGQPWVWIIDPLDGTKEFINHTGEYAVHIALAYEGRPVLGVVGCPPIGKLYAARLGHGTTVETAAGQRQPVSVSHTARPEDMILVASRSHRDARFAALLKQFPCQNYQSVGSVGGKIAAMVEQRADLYISVPGKSAPKDWDFAAPEIVLTEAGGRFTQLDGSPLRYNEAEVSQWGGAIASNGQCHNFLSATATQMLAAIDQHQATDGIVA